MGKTVDFRSEICVVPRLLSQKRKRQDKSEISLSDLHDLDVYVMHVKSDENAGITRDYVCCVLGVLCVLWSARMVETFEYAPGHLRTTWHVVLCSLQTRLRRPQNALLYAIHTPLPRTSNNCGVINPTPEANRQK